MDDGFDILLGHTEAATTQTYGNLAEGNLKKRVEMIEAVIYSSIETLS